MLVFREGVEGLPRLTRPEARNGARSQEDYFPHNIRFMLSSDPLTSSMTVFTPVVQ